MNEQHGWMNDMKQEMTDIPKAPGKGAGITKEDVVEMLVAIVRARPEEAEMDNPLCELKMSAKGAYAVFPDKFRAMERLSRMLGWEGSGSDAGEDGPAVDPLEELFAEIREGR